MRPRISLAAHDVLHAGKLHDDAVGALLLDHRLGDAELVHPLAERSDVLLERRVLDALLGFGPDGGVQARLRRVAGVQELEIGQRLGERPLRLLARFGVAEPDDDRAALAGDARVANVLVAQRRAHVAGERVEPFGERALHVDLQQEVHAAAQIQPEIHRQRADPGQPVRRRGEQVERDGVRRVLRIGVERLTEDVASP